MSSSNHDSQDNKRDVDTDGKNPGVDLGQNLHEHGSNANNPSATTVEDLKGEKQEEAQQDCPKEPSKAHPEGQEGRTQEAHAVTESTEKQKEGSNEGKGGGIQDVHNQESAQKVATKSKEKQEETPQDQPKEPPVSASREFLKQENRKLKKQLVASETIRSDLICASMEKIRTLKKQNTTLRDMNVSLVEGRGSLKSQLILALLQAMIGWTPPLYHRMKKNFKCLYCGDRVTTADDDDSPPLLAGERFQAGLELIFYFTVFMMDLVDTILDLIFSYQEMVGTASDDASEDTVVPQYRGWAICLFITTILGRMLAGVFGVLYQKIDKSDHEMTYFVVEFTIWCLEDACAFMLLGFKRHQNGTLSTLEWANYYLTLLCAIAFGIPFLIRWKQNTERLPPTSARVVTGFVAAVMAFFSCAFFPGFRMLFWNLPFNLYYIASITAYPAWVTIGLYLLFLWSHYLYKEAQEKQEKRQELLNDIESGNVSVTFRIA